MEDVAKKPRRIPRIWRSLKIAVRLLSYRFREMLFLVSLALWTAFLGCAGGPAPSAGEGSAVAHPVRGRVASPGRVDPIPLTRENLLAWANAATCRDTSHLPLLAPPTLASLATWGRLFPSDMAQRIGGMGLATFLGLSLSLHRTRILLARLARHDAAVGSVQECAWRPFAPPTALPALPDPPLLGGVDLANLSAYAGVYFHVEQAIADFLPRCAPLWPMATDGPANPVLEPEAVVRRALSRQGFENTLVRRR